MAQGGQLRWVFELMDRISAPAKRMGAALGAMGKALGMATDGTRKLGRGFDILRLDAFVNLASRAIGVIGAIGKGFWDASVGALEFKESSLASLELLLGSRDKAKDFFGQALAMAKATPFDTPEVIKNFQNLLAAGFSEAEVPIVFEGLSDIGSLGTEGGGEAMSRITDQLAQMKGKMVARMDDIKPIINSAAQAGIGYAQIYEQLQGMLGTDRAGVMAMFEAGQVSADQFTLGFLRAIQKRGGGKLGAITKRQAQTLRGLFSNLRSIPNDLMQSLDIDKMKGMDQFKKALQNIIDLFNTATPQGQRMVAVIERITDSFFSGIFGPAAAGKSGLEQQLEKLLSWAEAQNWQKIFHDIGEGLTVIAKALVEIARAAPIAFKAMGWAADKFAGMLPKGAEDMPGFKGYASPGAKFDEKGRLISGAMLRSDGQPLGSPGPQSVMPMAPGGFNLRPAETQSRQRPTINLAPGAFQFNVNGGDAEGISRALAEQLPSALASVFDRMGLETGTGTA